MKAFHGTISEPFQKGIQAAFHQSFGLFPSATGSQESGYRGMSPKRCWNRCEKPYHRLRNAASFLLATRMKFVNRPPMI